MKKRRYAILVLGVAVCLTAAALMAFGEGLLRKNHAGIASVIGIVGFGLVVASSSEGVQKKQNHQSEVC